MSSGSPSSQTSKPGAASTLLKRIASAKPILRREERLEVEHADAMRIGGCWICWTSAGEIEVVGRPPGVADRIVDEQRVLAAVRSASASTPASASRLVGRRRDAIARQSSSLVLRSGAANDFRIASGVPARLPGV